MNQTNLKTDSDTGPQPVVADCPFCGHTNMLTVISSGTHYHVECQYCGARGPGASDIAIGLRESDEPRVVTSKWSSIPDAVDAWNKRESHVI